jgi:O-acetyl-ADP-ribose deacetylase (regulator of RNase III)
MPEPSSITYLKGDATAPKATGNTIVAHICNDIGKWGKGFVLAVSRRWSSPEKQYREWYQDRENNNFALGNIQIVQAEKSIWIANMIGQHGIKSASKIPPIRYDALEQCLSHLANAAMELEASVHMPRIGCGLAGGKWECIEPLIEEQLCKRSVSVFVYDFE